MHDLTAAITILHEDPDLLVINKPSGVLCLPDGYHPEMPHLRSLLESRFGRLWIVHRLDKETSGIVLLARSAEAHHSLNQQFQDRHVRKIYHALIQGSPIWETLNIKEPLLVDGDRKHRTVINLERGKPAETDCTVLSRLDQATLLSVHPLSGYTHQIRAHLAFSGFPLLGDTLYGAGKPTADSPLQRVALHALSIEFHHPMDGRLIEFSAPYPGDFEAFFSN